MNTSTFPLTMANEGSRVNVVALLGGRDLDKRASEMGLNVGAELVIRHREGSRLVVSRGETRLALGGGMAHRILVSLALTADAGNGDSRRD